MRAAQVFVEQEQGQSSDGIGFAYGGIEPGRLHARGRLVETHKVYYSIGVVGTYLLHIGLRRAGMPVPGSPFTLTVLPGAACASSTSLPKELAWPLQVLYRITPDYPLIAH